MDFYRNMNDIGAETTVKVVVVGNANVGKTSLVRRYVDGTFDPEQPATIGVDFLGKSMDRDRQKFRLKIWDTAGQERFNTITPSFYRGSDIGIIVYDISNRASFNAVENWAQQMETYLTKTDMVKILVGNKQDKYRYVKQDEGRAIARKHNMLFTEASALTKDGVEYIFEIAVDKILARPVTVINSFDRPCFQLNSFAMKNSRKKCTKC